MANTGLQPDQIELPRRIQDRAAAAGIGSVRFIGNATMLIRCAGFTVLTDPNFLHRGDTIRVGAGLVRATRLTEPAMAIDELPHFDVCVLSHMHADHFDSVAEARLRRDLPIVTTTQAALALGRKGFAQTHGLRRWQAAELRKGGSGLRVTAMPGRHGPPVVSGFMPETMGSLLEFERASGQNPYRMYIRGDTLLFSAVREIPRRVPELDLAVLHLGGTKSMGMLLTMDAREGVEMLRLVPSRRAIPVHYNDYDVFTSPLSDFQARVREAGLEARMRYLEQGDVYEFEGA